LFEKKEAGVRFKGEVAVVTGAASGIGEAAAIAFAQEGAGVVIVDTDREQGEVVARKIEEQGGDVLVVPADVAREDEVQRMVEDVSARWGRLDVLVNNAGIYYQADVLDTPSDVWNDVLAVNLSGAFLCTKYAVPVMIRGGGGAVVNVASEAGLVGIKGQVAYNVSKGGMIALTRSCAVDLAGKGIRVNCVCPGTSDTPLVHAAVNRASDPAAARRALEEVRPLNRLGRPEEIAAAILYLASSEAGYATGAILSVDGGYTTQ
jgi:NAD(P)-dependent dehydrogenase (short-subunit alcohol dehydrogenase family)